MAIEAVAAVAAKEVAVEAAKEAALQSAREIAQKMATEVVGQGGNELPTAMMERQTMQEGFRVGEMPKNKGEGHELGKLHEADAAEELRGKICEEGAHPDGELPSQIDESKEQYLAEEKKQKEVESQESTENIRTIKTIRDDLAGKNNEKTGVPYVEKIVETDSGEKVKGVFPVFDSAFDAQLPDELCKASDRAQFAECNKQLSEAVAKDPELAKKFSKEQLEQIKNGDTPDGYTWHHNEEKGKMQLVDETIHTNTRHTGGKVIWGGGSEFR